MNADNIDSLLRLRGVKGRMNMSDVRGAAEALKTGFEASKESWPNVKDYNAEKNPVCQCSESSLHAEVDLMKAIVDVRAEECGIAAQTLCQTKELSLIAQGVRENIEVLQG